MRCNMLVCEIRKLVWNILGKGNAQKYSLRLFDAHWVFPRAHVALHLNRNSLFPSLVFTWGHSAPTSPPGTALTPQHTRALGNDLRSCRQCLKRRSTSCCHPGQGYLPWIHVVSHQLWMDLLLCSLWLVNKVSPVSGLSRSLQCILLSNTFSFHFTILIELVLKALTHLPVE